MAAAAAAIAAGVLYTASPLTAWCLLALAAVLAWTAAGLTPRERRWVLVTFGAAIVFRAAVIAILPLLTLAGPGPYRTLVPDASYIVRRSLWLRHYLAGEQVAPRDLFEAFQTYGDTTYHYVLAYLQVLLGPAPYGLHFFSVTLYVTAAALLYRYVRAGWGPVAAYASLVAVLFMPTPFFWSVSPLKEAALVFVPTAAVVAAIEAVRSRTWRRFLLAVAVLLLCAFAIDGIRQGALIMLAAGLALGLSLRAAALKPSFGVLALALLIPLGALGAGLPGVRERVMHQAVMAASRHMGHVNTVGHSYALLDQDYYSAAPAALSALTPREAARFVTASAIRFFTVPEPWSAVTRFELALLPQQTVWLVLTVLMLAGLRVGLARDALLTSLLAGMVIGGVVVIAPNSGNVGTLVRHRDSVAPFVFWMSGIGAVAAIAALGSRLRRRFNALDAGVAAILVLTASSYGLYLLLRPPAMEIAAVEPAEWSAGEPRRVALRGRHLRPFLHAYYVRTGEEVQFRPENPPREAAYLLRGPEAGELELPALAPATYDLVFYERGVELARRPRAFTIRAPASAAAEPPPGSDVALMTTIRFVGPPEVIALAKPDDRDARGAAAGGMRIVELRARGSAPDGSATLEAIVELRGRRPRPGEEVLFTTAEYELRGTVLRLSDGPRE